MKTFAIATALIAALGVSFEAGRWAQHTKMENVLNRVSIEFATVIADAAVNVVAGEMTRDEAHKAVTETIRKMLSNKD